MGRGAAGVHFHICGILWGKELLFVGKGIVKIHICFLLTGGREKENASCLFCPKGGESTKRRRLFRGSTLIYYLGYPLVSAPGRTFPHGPARAPSHGPGSLNGGNAVLFPFIARLFYHFYRGRVKALQGNK